MPPRQRDRQWGKRVRCIGALLRPAIRGSAGMLGRSIAMRQLNPRHRSADGTHMTLDTAAGTTRMDGAVSAPAPAPCAQRGLRVAAGMLVATSLFTTGC